MNAMRLWVAVFLLGVMASASTALCESFDTPLHEREVSAGRSPDGGHAKLTCDYFSSFLVKQLDMGSEGASWFAIVPAPRAGHPPACTQRHGAGETVIDGKDWCGYFQGAKQDFVFLSACNAYNGGSDFAVYDARTGKKVFQDTAVNFTEGGVEFSRAPGGGIALNYSRVVVFRCTLPREQDGCWSQIESKLGLENAAAPVCTTYEKQMTGTAIAYPVKVALTPAPAIRAVAGQIRCWPPE